MTVTRLMPPPLEPRAPDCSLCGEETHFEDGWCCERCNAWWPENSYDDPGNWADEDAEQCTATVQPWAGSTSYADLADNVYRCVLDNDSHDKHIGFRVDQVGRVDQTRPYRESYDWHGDGRYVPAGAVYGNAPRIITATIPGGEL